MLSIVYKLICSGKPGIYNRVFEKAFSHLSQKRLDIHLILLCKSTDCQGKNFQDIKAGVPFIKLPDG
jgi:hypothetical protein